MTERNHQPILLHRRVRKPIIVMGCARSATTMMGRILRLHPDVAIWWEPRSVWMYGHAYQSHDELGAADCTPRIARHIDRKFGRFLKQSGRSRFAEKTPSNTFRIPFIHALYPDCRIVNIIRDGRNVVRSILQVQKSFSSPDSKRIRERFAHTPIWEWPAYFPFFFRTTWRTRVLGKPPRFWGPMPKGWQQWEDLPRHLRVAEQWRSSVEASTRDGRALPAENYHEIMYENLMQRPVDVIRDMLEFVELAPSQDVFDYVEAKIDPNRTHRWKGTLSEEQEREVADRLGPTLEKLGYDLVTDESRD